MVGTRGIAGANRALILFCEMLHHDFLVVGFEDIGGDAFHAEDLDVEAGTTGVCIVDGLEGFLVDLGHMDAETWEILELASG